ncbi:MAG: DUF1549 domain-containing protein [Planctomycetes bacterium]|nr:DUF1549 domain-containing protein [Planctomycetota bacterium]
MPLGCSAIVLLGLAFAFGPSAPAQDKNQDKKTESKDETPSAGTKVIDIMVAKAGGLKQVEFINDMLEKGWKANKLTPSMRCDDYEFVRRASLDIIGRIATVEELKRFFDDPPAQRRSKLIERLLASDDYAQNWSNIWTVLLLTRTNSSKIYQEQMRDWLRAKLAERTENPKIPLLSKEKAYKELKADEKEWTGRLGEKDDGRFFVSIETGTQSVSRDLNLADKSGDPLRTYVKYKVKVTGKVVYPDKQNREQYEIWPARLDVIDPEFTKPYFPDWTEIVTELVSAQGITNSNGAVNFVLTHLGDANPPGEKSANGAYEMVPVTSRTTRLFLGLRTQCVQCHDHPFNGDWQQHHFWGLNAFFRQVDTPRGRPQMGKKKKGEALSQLELVDNKSLNPKGLVPYERRSGVILYTNATFLDGKKLELKESATTRRKELARFLVGSPYFAKAYVNRTWAHFFGRSFTKDAPDDFGEHNPVSNEELLNKLAKDWVDYKYNPKDLIRWICNSKAYGLSSVANKTNDKPDDEIFFSRMLLKTMTPEQLFESLMTATQAKVAQVKADKEKLRREWLDKLVVNFGDDEGNEGNFNGTVVQALMLMNGQDINTAIMDPEIGTVAVVRRKHGKEAFTGFNAGIRDLFLAALNRPPNTAEMRKLTDPKTYALAKSAPTKNVDAFVTAYYQDVFWAILNSNEFILNH